MRESIERQAEKIDVVGRPLDELAKRLEGLRESVDRQADQLDSGRLEEALRGAVEKLDRPGLVAGDIAPLIGAIEALAAKVERGEPAVDVARIEDLLTLLVERLDRPGVESADLVGVSDAIADLAARIEPAQTAFDPTRLEALVEHAVARLESAPDLSAVADAIADLSAKIEPAGFDSSRLEALVEQAVARFESTPDLSAVVDAIADLSARIDPTAFDSARLEALMEHAVARLESAPDVSGMAGAIADLSAKFDRGVATPDVSRVEALLEKVAARLERPGLGAAELGTLAQAITDLGARFEREGGAPPSSFLADLMQEVAVRLDTLESKIDVKGGESRSQDHGWMPVEQAVRELTERIGEVRAAADTRAVEQEIRVLQDKMDDLADARVSGVFVDQTAQLIARELSQRFSTANPEALLGHIQDIHERLDVISSTRPAPAALEQAMQELTEELEAFRSAREAVGRGAVTLSEMRAEQIQFDRRMDTRFAGVQDVLEKLVDRLGRMERDGNAEPTPPSGPTSVRAAAPARTAMLDIPDRAASDARPPPLLGAESPTIGAPLRDAGDGAKSVAISRHIAAARRAANAAAADSERREEMEEARKAAKTSGGFAQRAQAMFTQHRRPVLLGAAGLMTVLTGVAVYELRSGHTTVRQSEIDAPATTASPLAQARRDSDATAFDASPTGAIASTAKVITAPLPPAARTKSDPAATPPAALIAALPVGLPTALAGAGSNGDIGAEVEIAQRYLEGRTVPRDPKIAAGWMQAAADAGSAFAQYRLGALYEKGVGVTRDPARARELYLKAAAAGNARAMHNLAVLYAQDGGAGKPDYAAAMDWFRKAGGYGVRDSQFNLGVLYGRGLGATQDLAASWMWFSLAARQGDADATRKRDEVANRMDGRVMTAAKKMFDDFKLLTPNPAVNDPPPAPADAAADKPEASAAGVKG